MKKYLVVDFCESGIIYLIKTKGSDSTKDDILKYVKSTQTGSAIQNGNSSSNYTIHLVEITNKINELYKAFKFDEIVLNLPTLHDKIEIIPKATKPNAILKELIKLDSTYNTDNIVLHGKLSRSSSGNIVVPVSIVQKGYLKLINSIPSQIKVNITTNFTRLIFKSKNLIEKYGIEENFVVIDSGYSSTRVVILSSKGSPVGYHKVDFCGKEIIDRMNSDSIPQAIASFNKREDISPTALAYINNNITDVIKVLKSNANYCKLFIFGGLSTLPWHRLLKEFQLMSVDIAMGKECPADITNKLELLLDTDSDSCKIISTNNKSELLEEDDYDDLDEYDEEEDEEEEEVKPKRKSKKQKKVKEKKEKKPKKAKKQKDENHDDYEDYDGESDNLNDYEEEPKKNKNSTALLITTIITVCIISVFGFGMYLDYISANERPTVETADTSGNVSLTSYVKQIITDNNLSVSTVNNVVEGNIESLYIGLTDIDGVQLDTLTKQLEVECNVDITAVSEMTSEGKMDVNMKISYK